MNNWSVLTIFLLLCLDVMDIFAMTEFQQITFAKTVATRKTRPPTENGEPVIVRMGVYIESLSNFRTTDMSFDVDAYLRLSWKDRRLSRENLKTFANTSDIDPNEEDTILVNDVSSINKIWLPDLYIRNARKAELHDVMSPNYVLYIYKDGTVAFSARFTATLACGLDLRNYPFDKQSCDIKFSSYAHTTRQMIVLWFGYRAVTHHDTISLPELSVKDISGQNCHGRFLYARTEETSNITRDFSCLSVKIRLVRSLSSHMVHTYIPSGLIVCISWVSFWIDRQAVPARITLSFTTLLTLSTMGAGLRYALPAVSYAKAIDYWFGINLMFIFAALLQFSFVNMLTRRSTKFNKLAKEKVTLGLSKKQLIRITPNTVSPLLSFLHRKRSQVVSNY